MEEFITERASSGIVEFDDVLGGGFPREQMCLIEGDPGAGKTTLGLQFLLAGAQRGESALYVILAETEREVRRLAASHGWSLDGVTVVQGVSNEIQGEPDYSLYHPADVELEKAAGSILSLLERMKPKRAVFDSLSELRLLAEDRLRYRRQLMALKNQFQRYGTTALLLDFLTNHDDRQLESLCHGIISLDQMAPAYGGARRRLRVRKLRESEFRDGYHEFAIRRGGIKVFPRLVASEHRRDSFNIITGSSGVPALDSLLGGGLDRGTSTLLLGPAGVGKSTLAAQYVKAAVERGERASLFIFDEVPNTFVVRGEGLGMGIREHMAEGRIRLHQIDPATMGPGEFAHLVREAVEKDESEVILIDSLNGYMSAMPEERFLHAHLHELLAYLNQMGVVSILVMTQQGILGTNIAAPLDLSYLADTVVLLRYFEVAAEVRQAVSVVKRRTGVHERTIRELRLTSKGIEVGNVLKEFQGVLTGNLMYTGNRGGSPGEEKDGGIDQR
ncbi:ATPase domain-containing protein [Polyangium aurulentum]|uniref:ATPase domain-containing protein n=1 Tax=Polyangium aurulentum TaxID=2567896 RepID=UPI001F32A506|nr:ATPase domain-containing protein [Polyangium aurulentum]